MAPSPTSEYLVSSKTVFQSKKKRFLWLDIDGSYVFTCKHGSGETEGFRHRRGLGSAFISTTIFPPYIQEFLRIQSHEDMKRNFPGSSGGTWESPVNTPGQCTQSCTQYVRAHYDFMR
jgi:hypothetical protein